MTKPQPHTKPTKATLDYLRDLAMATGVSFAWPQTQREASKEIERLKKLRRTSRTERRRETRAVRRDVSSNHGDAASVREEELSGYGSTAAWGGRNG
jgi:hypothetical protein